LAIASRRAALSGNASLIASFCSLDFGGGGSGELVTDFGSETKVQQ